MQEEIVKNIILGEDEDYMINMGPQHPSTHGVLRFEVSLQGETIKSVVPHCGYIHRGIEKMCERDTYPQIIHLTDRMDYLSAHINNEAVCLCVEKALEVEVPERVNYIRTILDELNRIASHQLWWCAMGMDMGALTTFFYGLRDREKILDIFEESFGSRLIHSFNTPGGLMHDIHPGFQKRIKEFIKYFRKKLPEYDQLLTGNVIFRERTNRNRYLIKGRCHPVWCYRSFRHVVPDFHAMYGKLNPMVLMTRLISRRYFTRKAIPWPDIRSELMRCMNR